METTFLPFLDCFQAVLGYGIFDFLLFHECRQDRLINGVI